MSGQPAPIKLVEPFAKNAPNGNVPGGKTNPFPVASQIPLGLPGNASLDDGYTPLNMTPLVAGGIPMSGPDTNGVLYLYGTTIAAVGAGQVFQAYDNTYATAIGGYAVGAILAGVANPKALFMCITAGTNSDPETDHANWYLVNGALRSSSTPGAGTHADNTVGGPSDYFVDIDTTGGNVTLNGFVSQRDGQRLTITNIGTSTLTIGAFAGSTNNQVRSSGAIALLQWDSVTIGYCAAVNKWVIV